MVAAVVALSLMVMLVGCGEEEKSPTPDSTAVSVCEAVDGQVPDTKLAIRGSVIPLSELGAAGHPGSLIGFVLAADSCSIFVAAASRASVAGLERGEPLTVHGRVITLEDVEAERIRRILRLPDGADVIEKRVPSPTPIASGDPFVDGFSLTGE